MKPNPSVSIDSAMRVRRLLEHEAERLQHVGASRRPS